MCPASLDWRADKYSIMFTVVIAFVYFYHAERVLSAIAKFLVHLFGEGEGRDEMGDVRGRVREYRGKEEGEE